MQISIGSGGNNKLNRATALGTNADVVEAFFMEQGLPYIKGKVWTTDAIYRETRNQVAKRKRTVSNIT